LQFPGYDALTLGGASAQLIPKTTDFCNFALARVIRGLTALLEVWALLRRALGRKLFVCFLRGELAGELSCLRRLKRGAELKAVFVRKVIHVGRAQCRQLAVGGVATAETGQLVVVCVS